MKSFTSCHFKYASFVYPQAWKHFHFASWWYCLLFSWMNKVHLIWVWLTPSKARKKAACPHGKKHLSFPSTEALQRKSWSLPRQTLHSAWWRIPSLEQAEGSLACSAHRTVGPIFHMPKCWTLCLCSKVFGIPAGRHRLQFLRQNQRTSRAEKLWEAVWCEILIFEWEQRPPEMKCLALGSTARRRLSRGWICWRYLWRYRSAFLREGSLRAGFLLISSLSSLLTY